jgi:hypothetical protein
MDIILLLVILALAASGDMVDSRMPPEAPPVVNDTISVEPKTAKEQWNEIRQHPELTELSGEAKPYSPSPWAWLFKKPAGKEKLSPKAKSLAGGDKKGDQVGASDAVKSEESVKTKKNTTSAIKEENLDDGNKTKPSNDAVAKSQQKKQ